MHLIQIARLVLASVMHVATYLAGFMYSYVFKCPSLISAWIIQLSNKHGCSQHGYQNVRISVHNLI